MQPPGRDPGQLRAGRWADWFGIVLGLFLIGYGLHHYVQHRTFLARAIHVQGRIVGNWVTTIKGTNNYTAIFTFADAAGKTWRVFDQDFNDTPQPAVIGQACAVAYNPDDPGVAQLETPETMFHVVGYVGIFGILILVTSSFGLWKHRAVLRR